MKHIVQLSGGKDSTAMLLMMLECGMPVDEIIFCDTGCEFSELYQHLEAVEAYIGRKITRLKAPHSFEYYMADIPKIRHREGKGTVKAIEILAMVGHECLTAGAQSTLKSSQ